MDLGTRHSSPHRSVSCRTDLLTFIYIVTRRHCVCVRRILGKQTLSGSKKEAVSERAGGKIRLEQVETDKSADNGQMMVKICFEALQRHCSLLKLFALRIFGAESENH